MKAEERKQATECEKEKQRNEQIDKKQMKEKEKKNDANKRMKKQNERNKESQKKMNERSKTIWMKKRKYEMNDKKNEKTENK